MSFTTKKNASLLFILRLVKSAAQIVILSISAKFFGVGLDRDFYILAYTTVLVADLLIWGPINETFRTKFIYIIEEESESVAIKKTNSLFLFTNIITALICFLFFVFSPALSRLIAPAAHGENLGVLIFMLKLLAPSILFNQINALMTSILNAYHIFFVPELAGFAAALLNITLIFLLAPKIGIYSLIVAYYINLLCLFFLLVFFLKKKRIALLRYPFRFNFSDVKTFLLFALPYFVPFSFGQFNTIFEKSIASIIGSGAVSMLDYSRRIIDVPAGVISSVLATILVPTLSKAFIQKNEKVFNTEFINILQLGLFFFSLFVGFLAIGSQDIINILFNKGSIDAQSLSKITNLTLLYSIAAVGIFLYQIFSFTLLSSGQVRYTAFWGILPQILMIIFNLLLFKVIGVWIFPVSLFLAHFLTAFLYKKKYPYSLKKTPNEIVKYVCFFLLLALSARIMFFLFAEYLVFNSFVNLFIELGMFAILALLLMVILKISERKYLVKYYYVFRQKL